jgi:F-type H+-transporting ATPase subunit a
MIRKGIYILLFIMLAFVRLSAAPASDEHEKGFSTVDFVFDHISDSHEWFFITIGERHISIPLPVILISKHSGLQFFMSNKLYHPSEGFPFYIETEGKNEGKIVERLYTGEIAVPFDFSITKSVLGAMLVGLVLVLLAVYSRKKSKNNAGKAPKGLLNVVEVFVTFVRDQIAIPVIGQKHHRYTPFLITLFLFILMANLMGLVLPLGLNITSNIAVTFALATITFLITVFSGNRQYWAHIFNPDSPWFMKTPIVPLMQIIEVMGVIIKPTILMIRLFANMLAGHMIVTVLIALIFLMSAVVHPIAGASMSVLSVFFSVFMLMLDILVSFIQAYIFTLLSAMYFGNAVNSGH